MADGLFSATQLVGIGRYQASFSRHGEATLTRARGLMAKLRPGIALAMSYVFVLQTVLALSVVTLHAGLAAQSGDPGFLLCTGQDQTAQDATKHGDPAPAPRAPDCPLCSFAASNFTAPPDFDFQPLKRGFVLIAGTSKQPIALRVPDASPKLSQGPPGIA